MSDQNDVSCPVADTQPSLTEGMWGLFHNVKEQTGKIVNSINSELIRNEDLLIDSITSKVQSLGLVLPEKAESTSPVKDKDNNQKKTSLISPDVKQSFTDGLQSVERAMTKVSDSVVDSTFKLFGISVEDGEDRTQSRPGDDLESRELALQSDYSTYLADLDPEKNMAFASFKDTFDVKSILHQGEIVLETNSVVKKIFEELVPEQVSETDFWYRYIFHLRQLEIADLPDQPPNASRPSSTDTPTTQDQAVSPEDSGVNSGDASTQADSPTATQAESLGSPGTDSGYGTGLEEESSQNPPPRPGHSHSASDSSSMMSSSSWVGVEPEKVLEDEDDWGDWD
eukprot:843880_1